MAEGVHASRGVVGVLGERGEDDAGGPEDDRDRARCDDADAERGGLLVARSGDLGRLAHGRKPLGRDLERVQHLVRPAPPRDVEEERPGGVGRVDRPLAGQPETHVVLREHDAVDARVDLGLVPAQPQELRRGEAGERAVAGERDQALEPDALLDLGALGRRALVVPEDRRTEDLASLVEADEPVHLAREADAALRGAEPRERGLARAPPVLGILLRPAGLRRRQAVVLLGGRDDRLRRA